MDEIRLGKILQESEQIKPSLLVESFGLTIESVQALKEHSTKHLRANPSLAFKIADVAHKIGAFISPLAQAYGGWSLANAQIFLQDYRKAETYFLESRNILLRHDCVLDAARASIGLVYVWAYLGKNYQALELSHEIERILLNNREDVTDLGRLANLLMNVCTIYELKGEYEESISVSQRILEIAATLNDPLLLATLHHNLAHDFVHINAYREATLSFDAAEAIFISQDAHTELVRLYINRLGMLTKLDDLDAANATLHTARSHIQLVESNFMSHHRLALFEAQLAFVQQSSFPEELSEKLQDAQRFFADNGPQSDEGLSWLVIGELNLKSQTLVQAQRAFQSAYMIANAEVDRSLRYSAIYGQARTLEASGKLEDAISLYEDALHEIDRVRQNIRTDLYRSSFLVDKQIIFQDLARLYLTNNQLGHTYNTIERGRSRIIAEKLITQLQGSHTTDLPVQSEDDSATSSFYENVANLEALYQQADLSKIHHEQTSLDPKLGQKILHYENAISEQIQNIPVTSLGFSPLAVGHISPIRQVQKQLTNESLLYYNVMHDEVWGFVIQATGIIQHRKLGVLSDFDNLIGEVSVAIERALHLSCQLGIKRASTVANRLIANTNQTLHQLYQLLLHPFEGSMDSGRPLIISANDILSTVPFHALHDGTNYVIESRPVSYVPSGTILDICMSENAPSNSSLLIGYADDNLREVENEITFIADTLESPTIFQQDDATVEAFLNEAPRHDLIHLAMHAKFRSDNSMLSFLKFANRELLLKELSQIKLQASLVVLSGCETGTGENNGVDLLSLASAFFGAGVRSLLVSLWRVEDRATVLQMKTFYTLLSQGASKSHAMRAAQLAILERGQSRPDKALYQHPAFWAPFVLVGNGT